MSTHAPRILIVDACVLIDFLEADAQVLAVVARALGPIHVATPVLEEVGGFDAQTATSLGLSVVEPTFELFTQASQKGGGLSPNDRLCMLLAKSEGWTCVSNDKALRSACVSADVPVLWGLQLLGLAVEAGALGGAEATAIVRTIATMNPTIGSNLVEAFAAKYTSRK